MTGAVDHPLFSVIIPTRNRAEVFAVALQSVLDQRFRDFEVIVVDDGSAEDACRTLPRTVPQRRRCPRACLRWFPLGKATAPSYATNFGADHARGTYLCFLDDDDQWTDPEHLGRVAGVIAVERGRVDLVLANQKRLPQRRAG